MKLNIHIPYERLADMGLKSTTVGKTSKLFDNEVNLKYLFEVSLSEFQVGLDVKHKVNQIIKALPEARIQELIHTSAIGKDPKNFIRSIQENEFENKRMYLDSLTFIFKFDNDTREKFKLPKNAITLSTGLLISGPINDRNYVFELKRIELLDLPLERVNNHLDPQIDEVVYGELSLKNNMIDISNLFNGLRKSINIFDENNALNLEKWSSFSRAFITFLESKKDLKIPVFSFSEQFVTEEEGEELSRFAELIICDKNDEIDFSNSRRFIFINPEDPQEKTWMELKSKTKFDMVDIAEKEISALESKLQVEKDAKNHSLNKLETASVQITSLEKSISDADVKIFDLQQLFNHADAEVKKIESFTKIIVETIKEDEKEKKYYLDKIAAGKKQILSLKNKAITFENDVKNSGIPKNKENKNVDNENKEIQKIESDFIIYHDQISSLESSVSNLEETFQTRKAEMKEAEEYLHSIEKTLKETNDEKKQFLKSIKELESEISNAKNNLLRIDKNIASIFAQKDPIIKFVEEYQYVEFSKAKFEICKNDERTKKTMLFPKNSFDEYVNNQLFTASNYDVGMLTKFKRIRAGIESIKNGNYKNPYLGIALDNPLKTGVYSEKPKYSINLNQKQKAAVEMAVNATSIAYLQGPPGTGKTQTISAIAQSEINSKNSNVLITSSTHEAINNFFDRLYGDSLNNPNLIYLRMTPAENARQQEEAAKYSETMMYFNFLNSMDMNILSSNDEQYEKLIKNSKKFDVSWISRIMFDELKDFENLSLEQYKNIATINEATDLEVISKQEAYQDAEYGYRRFLKRRTSQDFQDFVHDLQQVATSLFSRGKIKIDELTNANNVLSKITPDNQKGKKFNEMIRNLNGKLKSSIKTEDYNSKNINFANRALNENKINVIGITTTAAQAISVFRNKKTLFIEYPIHFEIIDEVSKSATPEITNAALLANKILLAGDYRQLPPTNEISKEMIDEFSKFLTRNEDEFSRSRLSSKNPKDLESLIKTLYDFSLFKIHAMKLNKEKGAGVTGVAYQNLDVQHRFNDEIMELVNLVYDENEKLKMPENPRPFKAIELDFDKIYDNQVIMMDTSYLSKQFIDLKTESSIVKLNYGMKSFDQVQSIDGKFSPEKSARFNEYNAYVISKTIENIFENNDKKVEPEDIGVISMTKAQTRIIKDSIQRYLSKNTKLKNINLSKITVDTVDNFQGREKEIIIVDLVAARDKLIGGTVEHKETRDVEFYKRVERINVAISRARSLLVITGAVGDYLAKDITMEIETVGGAVPRQLFNEQLNKIKRNGGWIKTWEIF